MEKKYIIKLEDGESVYKTTIVSGYPMLQVIVPAPYIEPDREKAAADAFQRGYEHAKHECADCRKIRADAEQELADNAYQRGLNDAWEAARKIIHMPEGDLLNLFTECYSAVCTSVQVFLKYDASEAIEKIRQYEKGKEEQIQVGDEVRNIQHGWTAVVSAIDRECMTLMDTNGKLGDGYDMNRFIKTGRHFPEIAEVLKKMREE